MGVTRRITPQVRARAVEEYKRGVYPTRIARKCDITLATLRKWVREADLEWVKPNLQNYPETDKRFARFTQMLAEGRMRKEIIRKLHLGDTTYTAWLEYVGRQRTEWKPPHLTWAVWDEIKRRYEDGETLAHINTQMSLDTGLSAIQRWLVKAGYPRSGERTYE